jgi:hypothetical protein
MMLENILSLLGIGRSRRRRRGLVPPLALA